MSRIWKYLLLVIITTLLLAGCGRTVEERAKDGIKSAKEAFMLNDKKSNEDVEGIKLYKPAGFTINESTEAQNIVLMKNKEPFILFINPNEKKDSELFYELMNSDQGKKVISKKTFSHKGVFGFAAVVDIGDDQYELITSVGGAKLTTLTKKKNIEENMTKMMEIVRSIK